MARPKLTLRQVEALAESIASDVSSINKEFNTSVARRTEQALDECYSHDLVLQQCRQWMTTNAATGVQYLNDYVKAINAEVFASIPTSRSSHRYGYSLTTNIKQEIHLQSISNTNVQDIERIVRMKFEPQLEEITQP